MAKNSRKARQRSQRWAARGAAEPGLLTTSKKRRMEEQTSDLESIVDAEAFAVEKEFEMQPSYFVKREGGVCVPLIALDELPAWVQIVGVPPSLTDAEARARGGVTIHGPPPGKYRVVIHNDSPASKTSSQSTHSTHGAVQKYSPITPGTLGKKKYCSHWVRTGECDFMQQGCHFLHKIPDWETMQRELGLRSYPRWIREQPRRFQDAYVKDFNPSRLYQPLHQGPGPPLRTSDSESRQHHHQQHAEGHYSNHLRPPFPLPNLCGPDGNGPPPPKRSKRAPIEYQADFISFDHGQGSLTPKPGFGSSPTARADCDSLSPPLLYHTSRADHHDAMSIDGDIRDCTPPRPASRTSHHRDSGEDSPDFRTPRRDLSPPSPSAVHPAQPSEENVWPPREEMYSPTGEEASRLQARAEQAKKRDAAIAARKNRQQQPRRSSLAQGNSPRFQKNNGGGYFHQRTARGWNQAGRARGGGTRQGHTVDRHAAQEQRAVQGKRQATNKHHVEPVGGFDGAVPAVTAVSKVVDDGGPLINLDED